MGRPAIAVLAGMFALGACSPRPSPADGIPEPSYGEASLVIQTGPGEVRVRVELADEPEEQTRGLMFREELPPEAGMVFLHQEPRPGTFWMNDPLIPLSLAVWGEDGRIGAILDMEPCPEDPCPHYDPGVSWVGAVEVNRGFFERHGVQLGDSVRLER